MGLLSFLKRKSGDAPKKASAMPPEPVDTVQQARTRARQRLVGAVVLVAAGVIGFPLLFETQPRPLPVDTPIEIARKDGSAPSAPRATPAPRVSPPVVPPSVLTETPADAGREVVAAASAPAVVASAAPAEAKPAPKPPVEPKPESKPATPKPETKPEAKPADSARAQALLEGKEAKPAAADGRFVVQVGAFAEVAAAREARQKVEKLGLKTYTQVVETSSGKRIRVRVGPFASRVEADKAADKIKSAGLPSAVYTL